MTSDIGIHIPLELSQAGLLAPQLNNSIIIL